MVIEAPWCGANYRQNNDWMETSHKKKKGPPQGQGIKGWKVF